VNSKEGTCIISPSLGMSKFKWPSTEVPAPYGTTETTSTNVISSSLLSNASLQHKLKMSLTSSTFEG
jgi:hypothetical protein